MRHRLFFVLMPLFLLFAHSGFAADLPTILTCTVNAHADRNFGFREKAWMGPIPPFDKAPDSSRPFKIATKAGQNDVVFRDKIFSGLNTPKPMIRSVTPSIEGIEQEAFEAEGTVLSRTSDAVFIFWRNPFGNKVWVAAIDLTNRKATLSLLSQGVTSLNVEAETLDCR